MQYCRSSVRTLAFFILLLLVAASCISTEPIEPMRVAPGLLAFAVIDEECIVRVVDIHGRMISERLISGCAPRWSPDGQRLLVTNRPGTTAQVLEWETEGLELIQSPSPVIDRLPSFQDVAWGPKGERLVFASDEGLYLRHVSNAKLDLLLECDGQCRYVAWSPDGKSLAFTEKDSNSGSEATHLKILDINTGDVKVLLTVREGDNKWLPQPSLVGLDWSPDSKKLAFVGSLNQENRGGLYTFDVDSGEAYLVVPEPEPGWTGVTDILSAASWSPDGSQIVYAWVVNKSSDVFFSEIRVVDIATLENVTVWRHDGPPCIYSGPDWHGQP